MTEYAFCIHCGRTARYENPQTGEMLCEDCGADVPMPDPWRRITDQEAAARNAGPADPARGAGEYRSVAR